MSTQPGTGEIPAQAPGEPESGGKFEWHPRYGGRTVREVRNELRHEIERDQRAYGLVLEAADRDENATLATVIELERKWGTFDMDWATASAAELAETVVSFELERERRRELFPHGEHRASRDWLPARAAGSGRLGDGDERSTIPRSWRIVLPLVIAVIVAVVLFLALT